MVSVAIGSMVCAMATYGASHSSALQGGIRKGFREETQFIINIKIELPGEWGR